ncbi:MAG: hypothetical protein HWD59_12710 [Coxiellaceae bacterium]|nr:MAG: hypothetical protein HWD59_12710 [Coxiellaceae bacterium]
MKFSSFIGTIPSYNPEDRKREQQQALQNSSGVTQNMLDATVAALNSAIEKTENITIDTAIRQTLKTIQQNLEKLQSLKSNKDIRDKVIVQFREIQSILTIIELTNSINTAVLNVFSNTKQQNFFITA